MPEAVERVLRIPEARGDHDEVVAQLRVRIAEFEAVVGTTVFQRSRAGVELTPAGRDLLGRVRGVLGALEEVKEGIARLRDPELKLLRLAYSPVLEEVILPGSADVLKAIKAVAAY